MFGLRKTLGALFKLNQVDEVWFDDLEEALIKADVGVSTASQLIQALKKSAKSQSIQNPTDLHRILEQEIGSLLQIIEPAHNP